MHILAYYGRLVFVIDKKCEATDERMYVWLQRYDLRHVSWGQIMALTR